MAKTNNIRLNVSDEDGSVIRGVLVEEDGNARFILAYPYPGFDVAEDTVMVGRDVTLIATGPRDGQRISCTRG